MGLGVAAIATQPRSRPSLIDVHTHAIDVALPDLSPFHPQGKWPTVERTSDTEAQLTLGGQPYRRIDHRCWSAEARLSDMDRYNIALQVLSPIPVTFCYEQSASAAAELAVAQNEFFARIISRHPTRFAALCAVALQDPDAAVQELRRCMRQPGFLGAEIGTQIAGVELSDPRLDRFFAVAHELGALILVHPSDQVLSPRLPGLQLGFGAGMPLETATAAALLLCSGALARRPDVRICLAHGGGALSAIIGRLDKGAMLSGISAGSPELPSRLARQLWCDTITYNDQALQSAIDLFGADHVAFGTDYPFLAMPEPLDANVSDLPADLLRQISHTNMEDHYGAFPGLGNHPLPIAGWH